MRLNKLRERSVAHAVFRVKPT